MGDELADSGSGGTAVAESGQIMKDRAEERASETQLETRKYIPRKHLTLEEAGKIIGNSAEGLRAQISQTNGNTNSNGMLTLYESPDGMNFIDRLEFGRWVYSLKSQREKTGVSIARHFTDGTTNPFDTVEYEPRHVIIKDKGEDGKTRVVYEADVETPTAWTDNSITIAAQKYFYNPDRDDWKEKIKTLIGKPFEHSPKHLIGRVSRFFAEWGFRLGYFKSGDDKKAFEDELNFLQIHQMVAFNSPVYFNCGLFEQYGIEGTPGVRFIRDPDTGKVTRNSRGCYTRPQTHACFIKGPEDDLESLMRQVMVEASVFADGSGIGHDLSNIRADGEPLSSGGTASGPISFLQVYDSSAGIIKSGGKTRRAARMTTLKQDHPDIETFVNAKWREDYKALILMKAGITSGLNGEAIQTVSFQNTNLSVRLDDEFFDQIEKDGQIELKYVTTGRVARKISARSLLRQISFGSWRVGDPAVQYESKIQEMHTCPNSGRINSSNPCSEYMFLDDTSCNLNSLNLLAFCDSKGNLDIEKLRHAERIMTIAADIANDAGSYPNEDIARTSPEFRTIGCGYANLGALLMRRGIPYDSDQGRALAAGITALLHAEACRTSAEMAENLGTFVHYDANRVPMLAVMRKHRASIDDIGTLKGIYDSDFTTVSVEGLNAIIDAAKTTMDAAISTGQTSGFRNAQMTVLAPTGTISYLMGCDTTGVEPATSLKIFKLLAGGGSLELVCQEIPNALRNLGYTARNIDEIVGFVDKNGTVIGTPYLSTDHYSIFDTAFSPDNSGRVISFSGHFKMLGATQPFISGAISKTNNLPETATVRDIYDGYVLGHALGLKAVSVFRYNSKPVGVLTFGNNGSAKELTRGEKRDAPHQGDAYHIAVKIGDTTFHINITEYPDGTPAQIFINAAKWGSERGGMLSTLGINLSSMLAYGVPLEEITKKLRQVDHIPNGFTNDPAIKNVKSFEDFLGRFLELHYLGNLEAATNPEKVEISGLRGLRNGAIRANRRIGFDPWDYEQVMKDPETGGFIEEDASDELSRLLAEAEKRRKETMTCSGAPLCPKCGNSMRVKKAGCYDCNCGFDVGSCG